MYCLKMMSKSEVLEEICTRQVECIDYILDNYNIVKKNKSDDKVIYCFSSKRLNYLDNTIKKLDTNVYENLRNIWIKFNNKSKHVYDSTNTDEKNSRYNCFKVLVMIGLIIDSNNTGNKNKNMIKASVNHVQRILDDLVVDKLSNVNDSDDVNVMKEFMEIVKYIRLPPMICSDDDTDYISETQRYYANIVIPAFKLLCNILDSDDMMKKYKEYKLAMYMLCNIFVNGLITMLFESVSIESIYTIEIGNNRRMSTKIVGVGLLLFKMFGTNKMNTNLYKLLMYMPTNLSCANLLCNGSEDSNGPGKAIEYNNEMIMHYQCYHKYFIDNKFDIGIRWILGMSVVDKNDIKNVTTVHDDTTDIDKVYHKYITDATIINNKNRRCTKVDDISYGQIYHAPTGHLDRETMVYYKGSLNHICEEDKRTIKDEDASKGTKDIALQECNTIIYNIPYKMLVEDSGAKECLNKFDKDNEFIKYVYKSINACDESYDSKYDKHSLNIIIKLIDNLKYIRNDFTTAHKQNRDDRTYSKGCKKYILHEYTGVFDNVCGVSLKEVNDDKSNHYDELSIEQYNYIIKFPIIYKCGGLMIDYIKNYSDKIVGYNEYINIIDEHINMLHKVIGTELINIISNNRKELHDKYDKLLNDVALMIQTNNYDKVYDIIVKNDAYIKLDDKIQSIMLLFNIDIDNAVIKESLSVCINKFNTKYAKNTKYTVNDVNNLIKDIFKIVDYIEVNNISKVSELAFCSQRTNMSNKTDSQQSVSTIKSHGCCYPSAITACSLMPRASNVYNFHAQYCDDVKCFKCLFKDGLDIVLNNVNDNNYFVEYNGPLGNLNVSDNNKSNDKPMYNIVKYNQSGNHNVHMNIQYQNDVPADMKDVHIKSVQTLLDDINKRLDENIDYIYLIALNLININDFDIDNTSSYADFERQVNLVHNSRMILTGIIISSLTVMNAKNLVIKDKSDIMSSTVAAYGTHMDGFWHNIYRLSDTQNGNASLNNINTLFKVAFNKPTKEFKNCVMPMYKRMYESIVNNNKVEYLKICHEFNNYFVINHWMSSKLSPEVDTIDKEYNIFRFIFEDLHKIHDEMQKYISDNIDNKSLGTIDLYDTIFVNRLGGTINTVDSFAALLYTIIYTAANQ